MMFTPLANLVTLANFIGILMLVSGVSETVSFYSEEKGHRSGWMLASGILSTLFGIWAIFGRGTNALVAFLPYIFVVWVLSSGIMRIVGSVSLKSEGSLLKKSETISGNALVSEDDALQHIDGQIYVLLQCFSHSLHYIYPKSQLSADLLTSWNWLRLKSGASLHALTLFQDRAFFRLVFLPGSGLLNRRPLLFPKKYRLRIQAVLFHRQLSNA